MKISRTRFATLAFSLAALGGSLSAHAGGLRGAEPCKTSLEGSYVFLESDRNLSHPLEEDECKTYRLRDVGYLSPTLKIVRAPNESGKDELRVLQSASDQYPAFQFENQASEVENIGSAGSGPLNRLTASSLGRCQASHVMQVWHLGKGVKSPEKVSIVQRSSEMSELTLVQQKDGREILHVTTYERWRGEERSMTCRYLKQ